MPLHPLPLAPAQPQCLTHHPLLRSYLQRCVFAMEIHAAACVHYLSQCIVSLPFPVEYQPFSVSVYIDPLPLLIRHCCLLPVLSVTSNGSLSDASRVLVRETEFEDLLSSPPSFFLSRFHLTARHAHCLATLRGSDVSSSCSWGSALSPPVCNPATAADTAAARSHEGIDELKDEADRQVVVREEGSAEECAAAAVGHAIAAMSCDGREPARLDGGSDGATQRLTSAQAAVAATPAGGGDAVAGCGSESSCRLKVNEYICLPSPPSLPPPPPSPSVLPSHVVLFDSEERSLLPSLTCLGYFLVTAVLQH